MQRHSAQASARAGRTRIFGAVLLACIGTAVALPRHATAQTLTPAFIGYGYTLTDLGGVAGLPTSYGGLTIRASDPNTLYIGGEANTSAGALYTVALVRDGV